MIESKGRRLASTGKVRIVDSIEGVVDVAEVTGDTGPTYRVTRSPDGVFEGCSCPAVVRCSHIHAVAEFVTTPSHLERNPMTDLDPSRPFTDETPSEAPETVSEPEQPTEPESEAHTGAVEAYIEPVGPQPEAETVSAALVPLTDAPVTYQTLRAIANTDFVPASLRGRPEAILACVFYGRELGLGPMESLAHVDVIDGRPSPSAELLARLIRGAGHSIEVIEATDTICRLGGTRSDNGDTLEVTFTVADAVRAGLVSLDEHDNPRARSRNGKALPWESYTADLLWARAVSRLHRRLFPDITGHPISA